MASITKAAAMIMALSLVLGGVLRAAVDVVIGDWSMVAGDIGMAAAFLILTWVLKFVADRIDAAINTEAAG